MQQKQTHEYKTLELSKTNVKTTILSVFQELKDNIENVGSKLLGIINSDGVNLERTKLKLRTEKFIEQHLKL